MHNLYIGSDHAGFALKEALAPFIQSLGYEVTDLGARALDRADDYPDYATAVAEQVVKNPGSFGVVIGASGEGEAMAANRFPGVRAAVYYGPAPRSQTDADGTVLDLLTSARSHNDANILSLGARFISPQEAQEAVQKFLQTPFSGDARHVRRIAKF